MTKIALLAVDEPVRIDAQRLEQIFLELGEDAGTRMVCAALEQLATGLRRTVKAARQESLAEVAAGADRLSRLAWQLGLVSLAGVAVDVGACAEGRNLLGLAATSARLERIGNRSLTMLWDAETG
ncbi:hypothetical protein [Paracoccus sp. (in: a-proteobacteria)]|uniref:hypothetical protein n=1 Tax=Paracoccus sp. TaxID=267 RepID=UPI003220859F